jgi:hypothetical protein
MAGAGRPHRVFAQNTKKRHGDSACNHHDTEAARVTPGSTSAGLNALGRTPADGLEA